MSFFFIICDVAHLVLLPHLSFILLLKLPKGLCPKVSIPIRKPFGLKTLLISEMTLLKSNEEKDPPLTITSK